MLAERDRIARYSLLVTVLALVVSVLAVFVGVAGVVIGQNQYEEARKIDELSGPVILHETAVQYHFADLRPDPPDRKETDNPQVLKRDLRTFDAIYLRVTLTNVGRADTTVGRASLELPARPTPQVPQPRPLFVPARFCSDQSGRKSPCDDDGYRLEPGKRLYLYFSLKENFAALQGLDPNTGIPVDVMTSGVENGTVDFPAGVRIER